MSAEDPGDLAGIRRDLAQLRARIELMTPAGRARSLALTKLDEARLWVIEAFRDADGAQG